LIHIEPKYVLHDDDTSRVETCWKYYVLNFKYKLTLTYCALVGYCKMVYLNNARNERYYNKGGVSLKGTSRQSCVREWVH